MAAEPLLPDILKPLLSLREAKPGRDARTADSCCKRIAERVTLGKCGTPDFGSIQWEQLGLRLADLLTQESLGALRLISVLALHSLASNRALARQQLLTRALVASLAEADSLEFLTACASALSDLAISEEGTRSLLAQDAISVLLDRLLKLADASSVRPTKRKRRASPRSAAFLPLLEALFALLFSEAGPAIGELPCGKSSLALSVLHRLARTDKSLSQKQRGELCAVVARLSLEGEGLAASIAESNSDAVSFEDVVDFGPGGLEAFLQSSWENEPVILPLKHRRPRASAIAGPSSLLSNIEGLRSPEETLTILLKRAVGCPSPVAEETDVIRSLKELSAELGGPPIYGQDVTIVKTTGGKLDHFEERKGEHSGRAEESSPRPCKETAEGAISLTSPKKASPRIVTWEDSKAGFGRGFTIAIRGLQYRVPAIARLSEAFATALGQASVGVNAYVTPPNSQGLAAHCDDHCVFVCQLSGSKLWKVHEPSEGEHMPRLYAPRRQPELIGRIFREYMLEMGQTLYIPRGWTHVAEAMSEASLHVTFGVEVEEPFSWEGFFQTAVSAASPDESPLQGVFKDSDAVPKASPAPTQSSPPMREASCLPDSKQGPSSETRYLPSETLSLKASGREPGEVEDGGACSRGSDALLMSQRPRHPHQCREVIRQMAKQLPIFRKACLIGAFPGGKNGGAVLSSVGSTRVVDMLAELTQGAQKGFDRASRQDKDSQTEAGACDQRTLCRECSESALSEQTALRYLSILRQYQAARKRWNQAMLAVQNVQRY